MVVINDLIGLLGILLATVAGDLNDYLGSSALVDVRSALGIGYDAGQWIDSLYLSAQPLGMAISAWFMITLSLRRWSLAVIALIGITSLLIPFSPNIAVLYLLRILQGLGGGLMTPLLMDAALFVLPPPIRLYGLAVYALTATFVPSTAATLAALWTDLLDWHFVFWQAIPLCAGGALCVWYGMRQEEPEHHRFKMLNWRAIILIVIGIGAFTTMLFHGDRLDWFNSKVICVLALISAITLPLLLLNEWFHELPFLKIQMLVRRNFLFGSLVLFGFIIVSQASTVIPLQFLEVVQGLRPIQAHFITLEIASLQLILLPAIAFILNFEQVDARKVCLLGQVLLLAAAVGCSHVTIYWRLDQFYFWEAVAAIGQAMVVMPILMLATNTVRAKFEAPWASANVNFPRAIAEVVAVWLIDLTGRWRGALHSARLVDQIGLHRWPLVQGNGILPHRPPPLLPGGGQSAAGALNAFSNTISQQANILTISDTFLVFAAVIVAMMIVTILVPVRGLPPRLGAVSVE
jgi:DHA2 family multidrug resistance protein